MPIPHQRLHSCGVKGWIVDENGNPIPHAIVIVDDINNQTITDPDGYFEKKPVWEWHGACVMAPPSAWSLFPYYLYVPFFPDKEIWIIADGFPQQDFIIRYTGDDYYKAGKIMLYPQATSNYLATVMYDFEKTKQDIACVLLGEPNGGGWPTPTYSITDTTWITAILSEMTGPAEMVTNVAERTPDEDILCYLAFLDSSSNVISAGHIIHYDGTIKNNYIESVTKKAFLPSKPDVTWRLRSNAISRLVYDVVSKIKKRPDISPWKEEGDRK